MLKTQYNKEKNLIPISGIWDIPILYIILKG